MITLHTSVLPWWDTWIFCAGALTAILSLMFLVAFVLDRAHLLIQLGIGTSIVVLLLWLGIHLLTVSAYQSSHAHYRITATGMIPQVTQDLLHIRHTDNPTLAPPQIGAGPSLPASQAFSATLLHTTPPQAHPWVLLSAAPIPSTWTWTIPFTAPSLSTAALQHQAEAWRQADARTAALTLLRHLQDPSAFLQTHTLAITTVPVSAAQARMLLSALPPVAPYHAEAPLRTVLLLWER
ncbi:MAG: hypothetical protein C7B46_18985 [Sulfobacillus benefaciens]|uniref:Uncharacterized protein n=1 Tax=Sulfobacillus benefaciens TaxID=453960 RepID=A0A2T2X2G6_9FIRM|nr:MAG: hypothetical protein C7B46_18985 [Sulfobacillus benefaciens]